jgi:hypothetical protein
MLWPPHDEQRPIYVEISAAHPQIQNETAHAQLIANYMRQNPSWSSAERQKRVEYPGGRAYTSVLVDATDERQTITTFLSCGILVLIAAPTRTDMPEVESGRTLIFQSLSLGAPGKLRLNRPDTDARTQAVFGTWQFKGTTLTFRRDGTATSELHLPNDRTQPLIKPRQGRYEVRNGILHVRWAGTEEMPANEEFCVFRGTGPQLFMLCNGYADEVPYSRISAQDTPAVVKSLPGVLGIILGASTVLTFAATFLILFRFRRRMNVLMRRGSADLDTTDESLVGSAWAPKKRTWGGSPLLSQALQTKRKSLVVHVLAGLIGTGFLTVGFSSASGGFPPVRVLALFTAAAWPVVVSMGLVLGFKSKPWAGICGGYGLAFLAFGGTAQILGRWRGPFWQIPAMWLLMNTIPSALCLLFLRRSLRTVSPILFALWTMAGLGTWGLIHLAGTDLATAGWFARTMDALGLPLRAAIFTVLTAGLLLSIPFVAATFFLLVRFYEWRWTSDRSLLMDAIWFLFGVSSALVAGVDGDFPSALWCLLSFPGYWLSKEIGMRVARAGSSASGPALLVLRHFALGKRSETLFDRLTELWRFVGPVQLVAGADLASRIMQPQTFFSFAVGRLESRYVKSSAMLNNRLAESRETRDPDGRFRVDESFCYANSWFGAVAALIRRCDAALMDLRGMQGRCNRGGWERELSEILEVMSLDRLVLLIDDETDKDYLETALRETWQRLPAGSPNEARRVEEVKKIMVASKSDLDRVVKHVFDVVPFQKAGTQSTAFRV